MIFRGKSLELIKLSRLGGGDDSWKDEREKTFLITNLESFVRLWYVIV